MRYELDGLDPNALREVQALRDEIRELAEKKSRVGRERARKLDREIAAKKRRIGDLTGQHDKNRHHDGPLVGPTLPGGEQSAGRKGGQWVRVYRGGAPGSGKRS